MAVQVVLQLPVRQILQLLVANEQGVDIVAVERVAAVLQLVVVNHRHERMQHGSSYVAGIVVDIVNAQNLFHILGFVCKVTIFLP